MTFKDYILTYEKDRSIVANLFDYYEWFIKPLDKRFERYSYYTSATVLCFFKDHDDEDPSMGSIKDKKFKGVRVCHCFGCGRTADVVRLHQIISAQYHGKNLSEKDACNELATMFNIPLDEFEELDEDDYQGLFERKIRLVDRLKSRHTIRDYSSGLLKLRAESENGRVDLNKLNNECVKMIATVKQLYD